MEVTAVGVAAAMVVTVVGLWIVRRRRARSTSEHGAPPQSPGTATVEGAAGGLREVLAATRRRLREQVGAALAAPAGTEKGVYESLEEALIGADVGPRTSRRLLERLRTRVGSSLDPEIIRAGLCAEVGDLLADGGAVAPSTRPWVILVTGVNGVGKTTTIGKLAAAHRHAGRRVLIIAADTFRAAAIEQLALWAARSGADIVRHGSGADPSAVAHDGVRAAVSRGSDVVLVDTAGRLHTRGPLMEELRKVRRTIERELPGAPHETLLVVDATTGQNALSQARAFLEAAGVTGVVVTKLDGTARGGVVVAIREELGLPVRYIGVGEGVRDLHEFDGAGFAAALLGEAGDP